MKEGGGQVMDRQKLDSENSEMVTGQNIMNENLKVVSERRVYFYFTCIVGNVVCRREDREKQRSIRGSDGQVQAERGECAAHRSAGDVGVSKSCRLLKKFPETTKPAGDFTPTRPSFSSGSSHFPPGRCSHLIRQLIRSFYTHPMTVIKTQDEKLAKKQKT